jgi:SAM-dependent methyltransferase
MSLYDATFHTAHAAGSLRSARVVVPLVVDLVEPKSVVDVGCGLGWWLKAFMENGVDDVLGLDGDWIDRASLVIPADRFRAVDLTDPAPIGRTYNIVLYRGS